MEMKIDKWDFKHYGFVNGFGYPFLICTLTQLREDTEMKLEVIELLINFNKNNSGTDYQKFDVTQPREENLSEQDILDFGLEYGKDVLTGKISESKNKLALGNLPLKERELNISATYYLRLIPDFDEVKSYVTNETVSNSLKKELSNLEKLLSK